MSQHVTDFSKAPLNIILDLINHDHGTSLSVNEITIDAPVVVQDNRVSIVVRAVLKSGYSGQQTLHYNRVPLSALTALEVEQTTTIADVTSYQEVLVAFNAKYGVNITPEDVLIDNAEVLSEGYVQPLGPVMDVVVKAKTGSYVWSGETVFKLRSSDILLSDALPVTVLNGLWLPYDELADVPAGLHVSASDGEVRVTDEGHVRVFVI